jgi:hypothetical protein
LLDAQSSSSATLSLFIEQRVSAIPNGALQTHCRPERPAFSGNTYK